MGGPGWPILGPCLDAARFTYLLPGLLAFALVASVTLITVSHVSAAPLAPSGACSTGVGNVGGEGIICDVTIVNTITSGGGSATVTVY